MRKRVFRPANADPLAMYETKIEDHMEPDALINAVDLPTHLGQIPDRQLKMVNKCPRCGQKALYGIYEADTDATSDIGCLECGWDEELDGYGE